MKRNYFNKKFVSLPIKEVGQRSVALGDCSKSPILNVFSGSRVPLCIMSLLDRVITGRM